MNNLLPTTGFRFSFLFEIPLRQILLTLVLFPIAWAVFSSNTPYERYSLTNLGADTDMEVVYLPGRIFGVLVLFSGAFIVYRFGYALLWFQAAMLVAGVTTVLAVADATPYIVNVRQFLGIALYPVMFQATTRGLEARKIPTMAGPHLMARFLAYIITCEFAVGAVTFVGALC